MEPERKKYIVKTCRRYYNAMKTYGEPPKQFTNNDFKIVDEVCDLIRDKYKKTLREGLTNKQKDYLEIFTPELLIHAKY